MATETVTETVTETEADSDLIRGCATCSELGDERQCACPANSAKTQGEANTKWAIANCLDKKLRHWKRKSSPLALSIDKSGLAELEAASVPVDKETDGK